MISRSSKMDFGRLKYPFIANFRAACSPNCLQCFQMPRSMIPFSAISFCSVYHKVHIISTSDHFNHKVQVSIPLFQNQFF